MNQSSSAESEAINVVTDGRTAFVASPEGVAETIPAGEVFHVERSFPGEDTLVALGQATPIPGDQPLGTMTRQEADWLNTSTPGDEGLVASNGAFSAVPYHSQTGQSVAPVTIPTLGNAQGSASMVPAKTALDFQRLLTLALAYVPMHEQNLRMGIEQAIRVRVDQ